MTFNPKKSIIAATSIALLGYVFQHDSIKPDPARLQPLTDLPAPHDAASQKRDVGMFAYYSKWIQNFSAKIHPVSRNDTFPMPKETLEQFEMLKADIRAATVSAIDPDIPFVVETDASEFAIAATLNQAGRPVAFFSRTLNSSEVKHHAVEKEAYAIVECLREWRHFLLGRYFKIITDQESVSFMYNGRWKSKVKNNKITRWRLELSKYKYNVVYRPGKYNPVADAFSRVNSCSAILYTEDKHARYAWN